MAGYLYQLLEQIKSLFSNKVYELLSNENTVIGIDMSIESLRSKGFSEYIFWFLIMSLILFCYIIYLYLPKDMSTLKTGEKVMIGSIIVGVILAIIMGYVQLIEGYLL